MIGLKPCDFDSLKFEFLLFFNLKNIKNECDFFFFWRIFVFQSSIRLNCLLKMHWSLISSKISSKKKQRFLKKKKIQNEKKKVFELEKLFFLPKSGNWIIINTILFQFICIHSKEKFLTFLNIHYFLLIKKIVWTWLQIIIQQTWSQLEIPQKEELSGRMLIPFFLFFHSLSFSFYFFIFSILEIFV